MLPRKTIFALTFISFVFCSLTAQKVVVNTVGKDPFNGKANEIVYKLKDGEWTFQPFTNLSVKTTFRPADYTRGEQISDAVIAKPQPMLTKVIAGPSQTVELENLIRVVIQRDKFYYKLNNDVKVKSAAYFQQGEYRGFKFQLTDNEKFFGGGERALPMNRRGYRFNLYNNPWYGYGVGADNLNFSVPVIISSNGYGIFFDNPSKGYMDIGLTDKNILECGFVGGELTYYITFGKNIDEILNNYTALTGRQPLPPRWAFGNFVSRFGYRSEEQVRNVIKKMKDDKFPMDAVILDLFWFGDSIKGTLGNLDWVNTQKWPNPKLMIEDLKKTEGLKTILITEPFILQGTKTYNESIPYLATDKDAKPFILTDFYFGKGGIVDIFRKQSQEWIWKYYKKQMANGVTGWWVDLGEPEKHPNEIHHSLKDYGIQRLLSADEVHNAYGHYWSKMLSEKFMQEYPDIRLFHLNRSGFAGSQRYSVFPWTGDVSRNWNGLKAQLPVLLGMSLSGLPYVHSDAGGFSMADKSDPELYTRWLQFAAFTPIFRPHGTALEDLDPTVKSIPSEPTFWDEPHKSIVRNYINLRYQLLPYNYTLSYEQAVYGKPLMRTLYHYNFADSNAYRAEDQYYWGDNFLIAPVINQQATARMLYLPEGKWYKYANNTIVDGKQWINESVTINHMPVFVKAGSFVPVWMPATPITSTEIYNSRDVAIRYYPSSTQSNYVWYDDDGTTPKTLEKADYELITLTGQTVSSRINISINTNNLGNYKRKQTRKFRIAIPMSDGIFKEVKIDSKPVAADQFITNTDLFDNRFVLIPIEFAGKPMRIEIALK